MFVHVEANLQETSAAPRATSGSDHQRSALLGSIRGCILPPAPTPSLRRWMPEGSAALVKTVQHSVTFQEKSQTCTQHIHVTTKAGFYDFYNLRKVSADILRIKNRGRSM